MNAQDWRLWFIKQRFELHRILCDCLDAADTWEQQATTLCEHDLTVAAVARHAQMKIARAELVTVLGQRAKQ